ncbi:MAG: hypothetical protein ABWY31_00520, partial [Pseudoxanthomonas sp.]
MRGRRLHKHRARGRARLPVAVELRPGAGGAAALYESANTPLISFLNNSIKAKELFRNDKEYVVLEDEVLIV